MAYTTIDDPSAYFQTTIYTGDGSTSHAITNGGNSDLQPDWLWIKSRSSTEQHFAFDSVRGQSKYIFPNATNAEGTAGTGILFVISLYFYNILKYKNNKVRILAIC